MIYLKDIKKNYGNKVIFDGLNYKFDKQNHIYTIIGASGSGKTTLFNILYGLDQGYDGKYILNNNNMKANRNKDWNNIRSNNIGIVFQDYKLLEEFTVYDNLKYSYFGSQKEIQKRITEVLSIMNLLPEMKQKVKNLSGGQKQRLAIARAIINNPDVLLMDEPTGNLDDNNVNEIMEYINKIKEKVIIIIITHDSRIMKYSDEVIELVEGKLKLKKVKKEKHNEEDNLLKNKKKNFINPLLYFFSYVKSKFLDIIIINIPILIIIAIFVNILGIVTLNINDAKNVFFNGLNDKAIYISSSNYSDSYIKQNEKKGIYKTDDGVRINFSDSDLKTVEKIDKVKRAKLYNSSNICLYDNENYKLNYIIKKEKFSKKIKEMPSFSNAPSNIMFTFESMTIPYDYFNSFNSKNIILLEGRIPKENSNEILIPDILAYNLFNSREIGDKTIKLPVYNNVTEEIEKEYQIVGVYDTNAEQYIGNQYVIYVGYSETKLLELFYDPNTYNMMKQEDYNNNINVENYYNPIYENIESYKEAIGTTLSDMILEVESSEDLKKVGEELKKLFPNLKIYSQYELRYGETANTFTHINVVFQIAKIISIIILGIFIFFVSKNYIKNRSKELAILYSLGYSKLYVTLLIAIEYIITTIINLSIAYLLLYILQQVYFGNTSNYRLFKIILEPRMILEMSLYTFMIMAISIIFSLNGIKQKKLKKYLSNS